MTGYAFSLELRRYCIDPKNARKHNIAPGDLGSLHRIAANPEKSKHLETATTRVFNLEIDFVNLRKETYTHDSRNPIMEFGSAADDAYRRDATINALFYNLHSGEVEDLTGGLADMEAHLIRTPLTPLQTFTDDPLRVLRLIRFASRLQFTIDPAATAVMSERRVLDALSLKISRERVGIEIEKMLKGKHPLSSLRLIDNLNLYDSIFTDPGSTNRPVPNVSKWNRAYECLGRLADHRTEGSIYHTLALSGDGKSGDAVYFAWVLASVMPYAQAEAELSTSKGKTLPTTTVVAREGIKAPNRLCDVITAAYRHRADIAAWKQSMCTRQSRVAERDAIGMAIRNSHNRELAPLYAWVARNDGRFG
ncbi:CCA tRNA nucleotidyltransferase [Colletotrichum sidae]|uniref:CCA tRNA nucleotidyltransferase n=1 Tax=Colletotrichum sidae TaxID=1347389 RepID=A0A4R8SS65_9PEZI|nr:CCA tRNA nucleotidyltransferase [Colletotrichum sidae]